VNGHGKPPGGIGLGNAAYGALFYVCAFPDGKMRSGEMNFQNQNPSKFASKPSDPEKK